MKINTVENLMADQAGRVVTQLYEAVWLDTQRLYNMYQRLRSVVTQDEL